MTDVAVITGGAGGMGLATAQILGGDHTILLSDVKEGPLDRAVEEFDTEMGRLEADSGSRELAARSALGRFGRINEIAEVLAFCAGDKPGYLTGVDILVDGGADARMTIRDTLAMARQVR